MPLRHCLLIAALCAPGALAADTLDEDLLAAVRKSNVALVNELLAKGANVNAKSPYGQTPLFFACDRGSVEIVRILLDKGADVNAKDTFYNSTALTWAAEKERVEIIKLLMQHGAKDIGGVLSSAVQKGNTEMAKAAIATGKLGDGDLTNALAQAERAKKPEFVELLKAAGAKPRAPASAQVAPEVLASYAGKYMGGRGGTEMELVIKSEEGKLVLTGPGNPLHLAAVNNTRFRGVEFDQLELEFVAKDGKVTGLQVIQGGGTMDFKRVEAK